MIYITESARIKDLESIVIGSGRLRASQLVNVGSQVSGQIKSMHVQLGDRVTKGQLVAEIDATPQFNALQTAMAGLRQAAAQLHISDATLKQARAALERQRHLFENDVGTRQEFELSETANEIAEANVAAQRAAVQTSKIAVDTARANLGYTRITAPIDGQVVAVLAGEGQTVNANQTTPSLVMLANLNSIAVKVRISEADVVRVRPGQIARFTLLGEPGESHVSELKSIDPAPDTIASEGTMPSGGAASGGAPIYYNALLEVPNPDGRFRISMTAEVHIVLDEVKQALAIPSSALLAGSGNDVGSVRVLDPTGSPVTREIRLGLNTKTFVQVLDGLNPNDRVVIGQGVRAGESRASYQAK